MTDYNILPDRTEHLLQAANHVTLAIEHLEKAGYSVVIERLQDIFRHILKLISYLE